MLPGTPLHYKCMEQRTVTVQGALLQYNLTAEGVLPPVCSPGCHFNVRFETAAIVVMSMLHLCTLLADNDTGHKDVL